MDVSADHEARSSEDPSTEGLARRARSGDDARFGELYLRISPAVFAWASLRIPNALRPWLDAEDVVQEAWCRACNRFARFDPERGSFRAWTFGIARHVLLDALRRLAHRPLSGGQDEPGRAIDLEGVPERAVTVSSQLARSEDMAAHVSRVRELDENEQALFVQHGLEGASLAACGEGLGVSPEAAKKRWQRVRQKLADATLHALTDVSD
ncbi:MAG: hypothetical protein CMJ83_16075 [Planctomycetes bacterium]|nr:hypothetical protein [Planctomycetota bacterium]